MFDTVGQNIDDEALARQAKASLIAMVLTALVAGTVVAVGLWTVREVVLEKVIEDDLFEVALGDLDDELDMEAPPPPPPPPPPPASAAPDDDEDDDDDDDAEPDVDEMVEEVKDLKEEVKDEVKSEKRVKGDPDGVVGGVEGGVKGGVIGGVEGGVLGGQLGGGRPKMVHHSTLKAKRRPTPVYPQSAMGKKLGDQACIVTVQIDEKGVPYDARVDNPQGCHEDFHEAATGGILKWRWYPPPENVRVTTRIRVTFKNPN